MADEIKVSKLDGKAYVIHRDASGAIVGKSLALEQAPAPPAPPAQEEPQGPPSQPAPPKTLRERLQPKPNEGFPMAQSGETTTPISLEERLRRRSPEGPGGTFLDNAWQGLTTNDPTQGVGGFVGRAALPVAGSIVGTIAGAPAGGVGAIPGAGIGTAAGESARQALVSAVNPEERLGMTAGENLVDAAVPTAIQGGLGMLGQAGGQAISRGAKATYEALAPAVANVATKVPMKYTTAAVKGRLKGALPVEEAGQAYEEILKPLGLESLDANLMKATGKRLNVTGGDFMNVAETAAAALDEGKLTPQLALWGRQAIQKIKDNPKWGKEEFAGSARQLKDTQKAFDDYLETQMPGFAQVREDFFKAKAAKGFDSWYPQNLDGTPAVMRAWGSGIAALAYPPYTLPLALSTVPKAAKAGIDAVNAAGPVAGQLLRRAPLAAGESLRERLRSSGGAPPWLVPNPGR